MKNLGVFSIRKLSFIRGSLVSVNFHESMNMQDNQRDSRFASVHFTLLFAPLTWWAIKNKSRRKHDELFFENDSASQQCPRK